MNKHTAIAALLLLQVPFVAGGMDLSALCADRAAIERVYYEHRLGEKPPFEKALPPATLEGLVRQDLRKETALEKAYGVEITPALVAAEVRRIEATTRAPEVLAEIRLALGDDAGRFARSMARPILVERELRARFDNDNKLHAGKRHEAEQARAALLAGEPVPDMHEVTWQLIPRPQGEKPAPTAPPPPPTQSVAKSGAYSVDATAQLAQALDPSGENRDRKLYFEDLDPELQKVLRVQLQKPGDVSAVIEMPAGFLVFQAKAKTSAALTAASLSIPKRAYEEWLAQQPESKP